MSNPRVKSWPLSFRIHALWQKKWKGKGARAQRVPTTALISFTTAEFDRGVQ